MKPQISPGNCNLCGCDRFYHFFDESHIAGYTFSVVQCKQCGLIATTPLPDDAFLRQLYSAESYKDHTVSGVYCLDTKISPADHQKVLSRLESLSQGRRLLDVGCGVGTFVRTALDACWDAYGIEPSPFASEIAQANIKQRIYSGFLHVSDFAEASFDVITLWYVLEHVRDPRHTLEYCYKLLKARGIIFVAVPNVRYLLFRRKVVQIITGKPGSVYAHEHLYQYTPKTLKMFLHKTNFEFLSEHSASPHMVSGSIVNTIKRVCNIIVSTLFSVTGINLGGILMFGKKSTYPNEEISNLKNS
jgi:2-polyprenyl-3-methyl-5-hydroxy-6-metoxy-1,4-benzoquinol methylase